MKFQSRRLQLRDRYRRQKRSQKLFFYLSGFILFCLIFAFLVFAWFAKDLPAPGKLSQVSCASSVFYDRDGEILFETYKDKNRVPVELKDVSDYLKNATISIDDKKYNKDQIFQMYLNEAPYGGSFWGIGSASKGYFDKSPKDLTLVESAFLAGLPQRPNYFSPFYGKNDTWKQRAKDVLRRMREDRYITRAEESSALKGLERLKFEEPNLSINAPHFVFYVRDQIEKEFGSKILDQGLRVKTTLSLETQRSVEKIV